MAQADRNQRYDQEIYPLLLPESLSEPPELWVNGIGTFRSHGGFRYFQHCSMYTLHVITAGEGTFEFDGEPLTARQGDLVAFYPGHVVRYYDTSEHPWRYLWVRLEGRLAQWLLDSSGFHRQRPVRRSPSTAVEAHTRHLLERATGTMPPHYPIIWCWQFADLLASTDNRDAPLNLAQACRALIDDDFSQSVTVEELAQRLEVDRATLFRHFRSAYGISPKTYIDQLRLHKARDLLTETHLPVKEIAMLCGYNSPDYFIRRFRQATGQPPGQWRKASP